MEVAIFLAIMSPAVDNLTYQLVPALRAGRATKQTYMNGKMRIMTTIRLPLSRYDRSRLNT
jgi:hypothetical protein